jgi:hypothetical protein
LSQPDAVWLPCLFYDWNQRKKSFSKKSCGIMSKCQFHPRTLHFLMSKLGIVGLALYSKSADLLVCFANNFLIFLIFNPHPFWKKNLNIIFVKSQVSNIRWHIPIRFFNLWYSKSV